MRRFVIFVLIGPLVGIGAVLFYAWYLGGQYIAPVNQAAGRVPSDLPFQTVDVGGRRAWWLPVKTGEKCALLLHGVRSSRRSMLSRARFFAKHGYTSLLLDFQAHGESPGEYISFGHLEAEDARLGLQYLRKKACHKVVVLGQSMGGAAAILAQPPLQVDALVVESVYGSIEEAIANRMKKRFGEYGVWLTPLLLYQLPIRLDIPLDQLNPAESIKQLSAPVFILAGDNDRRTLLPETRRLFKNAGSKKKRLWVVKGAKHQDLYKFAPPEYERRILRFLDEVL